MTVAPEEEADALSPLQPLWQPLSLSQWRDVLPQNLKDAMRQRSTNVRLEPTYPEELQHLPYWYTPYRAKSFGPASELQMELLNWLPQRPSQRGLEPSSAQLQAGLPRVAFGTLQLPKSLWHPEPQKSDVPPHCLVFSLALAEYQTMKFLPYPNWLQHGETPSALHINPTDFPHVAFTVSTGYGLEAVVDAFQDRVVFAALPKWKSCNN